MNIINAGSRINFGPLSRSSNSESDFKNGHISRFCPVFQVIQVISPGKFCSAEEIDLSFISITKPPLTKPPDFKPFFFEDRENVLLQMS